MPTSNIVITTSWTKIADISDSSLLVTWNSPIEIEVATTTPNTAPTVNGHLLTKDSAITRSAIGAGYVWAKIVPDARVSKLSLIVTK